MTMQQLATNDHDLLIQLHSKTDGILDELKIIKDLEYRTRQIEEKGSRHSEKIKAVEGELHDSVLEIKDDIKSLKNRDLWQAIALILGSIVAGVIVWFK